MPSPMPRDVLTLFPELEREFRAIATTGIFPSQVIRQLIDSGRVAADTPLTDEQVQPASLDLRLGPIAYRLQASFLPGAASTVEKKLKSMTMAVLDLEQGAVLERGCVYLVPLMERLRLPENVSAIANPKSTTGRLDVFTRLITDYGDEFERVAEAYVGPLYAEIVPRTFSIVVRPGMRLSQLRFVRGNPISRDSELHDIHKEETLVYTEEDSPGEPIIQKGLKVSLSLKSQDDGGGAWPVAFRAKRNAPVIDLGMINHYDPDLFWDVIPAPSDARLILNPGDFYILASRERVRVPPLYAAEMVPFDPSVGEFRIHYAGFFDPGFGYGLSDIRGTRAVLEVRAHEVPFQVEDGQIVGRLVYIRLTGAPDRVYGTSIGSSYQSQQLTLSKQFRRR
jgi:dCTP deaminase